MAKKSENIVFQGTGRRKESIARVRLMAGKGNITVNGKTLDEYFDTLNDYEFEYRYAQRTPETGLSKYMEFGEDYNKLVLELDVLNNDSAKLSKIDRYMKNKFGNNSIYDIIINVIN